MNDKPRSLVTASELYVLIAREFRRRQPRECPACFLELPCMGGESVPQGANWSLALPADCGGACRGILEDIVAEYAQRYELRRG
ncbi:MAG TPA: hypothetical protein VFE23_20745 [Usitatibacter sp.]|jgi:hypothetical protein|nr:hypothetical protein [Usitatibacter sp.]